MNECSLLFPCFCYERFILRLILALAEVWERKDGDLDSVGTRVG